MRWLGLAVACVIWCAAPAQARQDEQTYALRVVLKSLQTALTNPATADFSVATLFQQSGLAPYVSSDKPGLTLIQPTSAAAQPDPLQAQRLDLRLAMTMISQAYGPDDTFGVIAAQTNPDKSALVLRKGRATLADLRRLLAETRLQPVSPNGALVLEVPLIIWSGATLVLQPGEQIGLSRTNGAFLANFGHLDIDGASISGAGGANRAIPSFMPFVITADGGTVQARNARFANLGFGSTLTFAGFSVMRGILHTADRQNRIENSIFENLTSVAANGAADILFQGNQFRQMRGPALIVHRSLDATIKGNLFSGKMPTNAIRLIEGSAGGHIEGNVILGGKHVGILVANDSTGALIARNVVWHRDGSGISLLQSDCGRVIENVVVDNRQKGIEVRISLETKVERNTILSNQNAGIWVAGQLMGAQTHLTDNVFAANGSGINGAIGETILMTSNDFSNQFPQFLSGDLTAQFTSVALDLHGKRPITLLAADSVKHPALTTNCDN